MSHFMQGRYGNDYLNRFLSITALVLIIVEMFLKGIPRTIVSSIAIVLIILCYFRMFSRNIAARYEENRRYMVLRDKCRVIFNPKEMRRRMDQKKVDRIRNKDFHIYKCPMCGQKIRIPKGKGKIIITCPKCRHEFAKRS